MNSMKLSSATLDKKNKNELRSRAEIMKFPENFSLDQLPWLNTNTFWFTLTDLVQYNKDLPWILAEKAIPECDVIQLERFACDVNLPSQYVLVERAQRFWPIKRYADLLEYRQQTTFQELLRRQFSVLFLCRQHPRL